MEIIFLVAVGIVFIWYTRRQNRIERLANANASRKNNMEAYLPRLKDNAGAFKEYSDKMGQFKNATLNWVKENYGQLNKLPEHILTPLTAYLVEASSSACRYAGVDESLINLTNLNLLKQMGFPEDVAQGMLDALSNPLPQGKELMFDLGGSAFSSWVRDGDAAALDHIQQAMVKWANNETIANEIISVMKANPAEPNENTEMRACVEFANQVVEALSTQIILFAHNGKMPKKAMDNWSIGYVVGFTDALLKLNGQISEDNWGKVEMSVFMSVFGEEDGAICFQEYVELFSAGDKEIFEGVHLAEDEVSYWVSNKENNKSAVPLGWGNHVHGISAKDIAGLKVTNWGV